MKIIYIYLREIKLTHVHTKICTHLVVFIVKKWKPPKYLSTMKGKMKCDIFSKKMNEHQYMLQCG